MGDRPLECVLCKKTVCVIYRELVSGSVSTTEMCADCPVFSEKLRGRPFLSEATAKEGRGMELCCNACHTSSKEIKMGGLLGCAECYSAFGDMLLAELAQTQQIPPKLQKECLAKKPPSLHLGKSPGHSAPTSPSSQLTTFNEALNEALKKENYEQAAWLRDQIKSLTEKNGGGAHESSP